MKRFLGITLVVFSFAFFSLGLELSLTRGQTAGTGSRSLCGVLVCAENTRPPTSDNDTLAFNSILSMSIFKRAQSIPVASVTTQESKLTRVADGMKIASSLDSAGASIRIELVKVDDCDAEFSCEVRGVTSQGREAVIKDSFVQQCNQKGKKEWVEDDRSIMTVHLQLLTSVTQLITQSMARQEDILKKIHKDTRDQMNTFERHLEDKLSLFENRVEDKIVNNNSLNKLIQLNAKVSTALEDFRAQTKQDIDGGLVKITQEMKEELKKTSEAISENIVKTQNNISELVFSIGNDFDILKTYGQTNLLTTKNETARIQEGLESQENVCRIYQNDTISLNYKILTSFKDFESSTKNVSSTTLSELKDSLSELVQSLSHKIKNLTEGIAPRTCKKGMAPVATTSRFYRMMYDEPGLIFSYLCDTVTKNGGWILIQRRVNGNVNFDKTWADYKKGFGSLDGDFWLGNDIIYSITNSGTYELRVELRYKGKDAFAHYDTFSIEDENYRYRLLIGNYYGTAGDSLRRHDSYFFSTADSDNDASLSRNCAEIEGGGWWFDWCSTSNLNGHWGLHGDGGVEWEEFTGHDSASYTEMKIRQV